jgi:hypothetical protein
MQKATRRSTLIRRGGGNPDAPVQMIDHFANARGKRDPLIYSGILVHVYAHNIHLQNPIVANVCYT